MVSVIGILFFNLTTNRPPMAAYDKITWAQRLLSQILILCKSIDSTHGPYTKHQQMPVTSLWPVQLWWPNKNSCSPEVTQSSNSSIHIWFEQVIADFYYFFLTSHLFIDGEHVIKCYFPTGNIAPVLKATFMANCFRDSQKRSPFFHLWHLPQESALSVDVAQRSRFSFCQLYLAESVNLIGLTGKISKKYMLSASLSAWGFPGG